MRYHEAASFLFDLRRFSTSPGTESVEDLLDHLGNPEDEFDAIQVAGSNGKGSTARMTESVLREAGLSVGLYTSPHLTDLSERVRVDGRPMPDGAIADFVAEARPWLVERAAADEPLTFFEVVTAMALHEFARRDVDVAVLEVGMGGEYDATSVVDPRVAAVTNVSLEHTSVLGDTIGEISRTKTRIVEGGVPLVTACGGEALSVVREVAADAGSSVTTVTGPGVEDPDPDAAVEASYGGRIGPADAAVRVAATAAADGWDWSYDARIPMVGEYQATNAGLAVALAHRTAEELGADLPDTAVADGLARATWPGRFEVMGTEPLVVLDGAHNPAACETLSGTLASYDYGELHLVFGAMHDKDHPGTVRSLPDPDSVVTCRPDLDRSEDPEVLAAAFRNAGIDDVRAEDSVTTALRDARARAGPDDCVLLTGSLFAVAEARAAYMRSVTPRRVGDADDAAALLRDADVPDADVDRLRGSVAHATLTTEVDADAASRLRVEAAEAGVVAGVSGIRGGGELVRVVLAGTEAELGALADRLAAADPGLVDVADGVRARLGGEATVTDATDATDETATDTTADTPYPWTNGTAVMGVLNATPDSFHDGGLHEAHDDAVSTATRMIDAGADIVDVGGESTRPGADPVPVAEEIDRVVPVVESLRELPAVAVGDVVVSVDTRKPAVAEAALDAGADLVNDVTGLVDPRMRELVADRGCPVVVMHSVEAPVDPDTDVEYGDVVDDVRRDLAERLLLAERAGIDRKKVIVDPGIGFGKSAGESFDLLGRLDEFAALGCPVMVGHSHKSLFAGIGRAADDREHATVAATSLAVERGADVVRVHDVAENRAAVDVVEAANDPDRIE